MYLPGMSSNDYDRILPHSILKVTTEAASSAFEHPARHTGKHGPEMVKRAPQLPNKKVAFDLPNDPVEVQPFTDETTDGIVSGKADTSRYISYYGNPMKPKMWFKRPKHNRRNTAAAIVLQRAARGMCARTKFYLLRLESTLARIQREQANELRAIEQKKKDKMLQMRRKATKKEAKRIQQHMESAETANQGANIIHYLRNQNKKLRTRNTKIAESIVELTRHNKRLEQATTTTGASESLLTDHYDKIKKTNTALQLVVPQYEKRLGELQEAMDTRRQFCLTEHKMKVLYVNVIGSLADAVQGRSKDKDLVDEVVTNCLATQGKYPVGSLGEDSSSSSEGGDADCSDGFNESSFDGDGDGSYSDSDSNDYDEYNIAVFERGE